MRSLGRVSLAMALLADGINHWFGVLNGSAYMNFANQYLFGERELVRLLGTDESPQWNSSEK